MANFNEVFESEVSNKEENIKSKVDFFPGITEEIKDFESVWVFKSGQGKDDYIIAQMYKKSRRIKGKGNTITEALAELEENLTSNKVNVLECDKHTYKEETSLEKLINSCAGGVSVALPQEHKKELTEANSEEEKQNLRDTFKIQASIQYFADDKKERALINNEKTIVLIDSISDIVTQDIFAQDIELESK